MKIFQKLGFLTVAFVAIFFSCSKDGEVKSVEPNSFCGNVTDIDGNIYPTVKIGEQCWTQKNLNVSKYRNGDPIPQVTDPTQWQNLKTGAWCYYENKTDNGIVYGKLYNWYAVKDPRGLAPIGYHIPTDAEWTILTTFLGGESVAGKNMKATKGWLDYIGITNTNGSGITGLPGGSRTSFGDFSSLGYFGFWWSASESMINAAWNRTLLYSHDIASRYDSYKEDGFSVRCLRD